MTAPLDPLRTLVDAAREGDDRAVEVLVRATQPLVWRVCSALGSHGVVEDLVQETYLRALQSLGGYRADAPVNAWLTSIAHHVCADDVRRRIRRRKLRQRLEAVYEPGVAGGADGTHDLLDALCHERRESFVLTQLAGLSYEAAQVIGCPIGTVRSRVSRARADLVAMTERAEAR